MTEVKMDKTITSIFMVPTLKVPKDALKNNGFINGYVKDSRRDVQYEDSIYLLFKPIDLDRFREFLDSEYERTKSVIDDYDYEDGFVVVVYQLNPFFTTDFDLVRESRYSKTSKEFQAMFSRVVKIVINGLHRDELSLQYKIFNKTEDLVEYWEKKFDMTMGSEQEVWEGYKEENEVLDLEKIKELEHG